MWTVLIFINFTDLKYNPITMYTKMIDHLSQVKLAARHLLVRISFVRP